MAQWQKFLLGSALVTLISIPVHAAMAEENAPEAAAQTVETPAEAPQNDETAALPDHLLGAPPEIMSEPAAANPDEAPAAPPACAEAGLLENAAEKIALFYPFPAANVAKEEAALSARADGGIMLIDGVQYTLRSIELPKEPLLPFSGVRYPMEARFVHHDANGNVAVLSVPVAEGAANLAAEKMLEQDANIDPNDLLPASREFAAIGRPAGEACDAEASERRYVLKTPIQMSATQIRKFADLF